MPGHDPRAGWLAELRHSLAQPNTTSAADNALVEQEVALFEKIYQPATTLQGVLVQLEALQLAAEHELITLEYHQPGLHSIMHTIRGLLAEGRL